MAPNEFHLSLEKVDFRKPTQVTDNTSILTLKNLVFEPLLRWKPGGLVSPALFKSWEHSPDGRLWTFHVRDHARFHDGEECLASHIIDFIDAILGSRDTFGMKWSYQRYLADTKIAARDSRTIEIWNPEPIAAILDIFTEFYVCRLAPNDEPIQGTGPHRVVEFDREAGRAVIERIEVEVEPKHIGLINHPQRIIATAEPSAEKRLSQVLLGEVDASLNLERVGRALDFTPDVQWGKATNTLSIIFYLNCQRGVFVAPEARLAVNHAVDTEALAREVFHGLAVPATTIVSPDHLGSQDAGLSPIPYDPAKARQLLSGFSTTEKTIVVRTPTYMPERAEAITAFVVASLEAVGFVVEVQVEPDRASYARQVGLDKNIGDMALFDSSPHSTFRVLDDKISSMTKAVWWQGYQDEETDTLIKLASNAIEECDRQRAYAQCLKQLQHNPPWLYLVHPTEVFAARTGIQGLNVDCKGVLNIG
ncbi:hypothetical protein WAI453_004767 [Rhynchosporium graminicola]